MISNAIKFTRSHGVITVAMRITEMIESDKLILSVTVQDSGIGMEQNEMERIFSRFVQANHRTYSEYGGSGLGLFICKNLVQLMGGTINVESVKNKGSKFTFTVPCTKVTVSVVPVGSTTKRHKSLPQITTTPGTPKKQCNILIVEDNL